MVDRRIDRSTQVRRRLIEAFEDGCVITSREIKEVYVEEGLTKAGADGWIIDGYRNFGRTAGVPVARVKLMRGFGFYDARLNLELETDIKEVRKGQI